MQIREQVKEAMLKVDPLFWETSDIDIIGAWNGIGPAWLSNTIRKRITYALQFYRLVYIIHDFDFKFCIDRSRKSFNKSNDRAKINMAILRETLPWYRFIKRFMLRKAAHVLYYFCDEHGWSAWQVANR